MFHQPAEPPDPPKAVCNVPIDVFTVPTDVFIEVFLVKISLKYGVEGPFLVNH